MKLDLVQWIMRQEKYYNIKLLYQMQKQNTYIVFSAANIEQSRHPKQRAPDVSSQNEYSFKLSPILHEQLFLSMLNYQSVQKQDQPSFSIKDLVMSLHNQYYTYSDPEEYQSFDQDRLRIIRSLQQINSQYLQKMQVINIEIESKHQRAKFFEEDSVKYYKEDDATIEISNYEEFYSSTQSQNDYLQRFHQ